VRAQFRFYLAGLLRTSLEGRDRPEMHLYNSHYMAALDAARWYQAWARAPPPPAIAQLPPGYLLAVLRIRMFLGLLDPDPLVIGTGMDPDPDPSIIKQK
jgi:hypothetical protein